MGQLAKLRLAETKVVGEICIFKDRNGGLGQATRNPLTEAKSCDNVMALMQKSMRHGQLRHLVFPQAWEDWLRENMARD